MEYEIVERKVTKDFIKIDGREISVNAFLRMMEGMEDTTSDDTQMFIDDKDAEIFVKEGIMTSLNGSCEYYCIDKEKCKQLRE